MRPGIRRALQVAAVALLGGLVLLFAEGLVRNQTTVAALVDDGQQPSAPNIQLPNLFGHGTTSLTSLRGKVVLVNFWASWCNDCRNEAPLFESLQRDYAGRMTVLGVDASDFVGDGRRFAQQYRITYPLVHDTGSVLNRWVGQPSFPDTFVIDRRGRVVAYFNGAVTYANLASVLRKQLGAPA
ncbi:MAG TPA: TlpA disulfide reductase family protein [Thermoleophilia bacterium]|nr:TlpA disulfide reductase family protein [Thermoleophilia bacterium]